MYKIILRNSLLTFVIMIVIKTVSSWLWNKEQSLNSILIDSLFFALIFSFLFVRFFIYPETKSNLKKVGINIEDYDWSPVQNLVISNEHANFLEKIKSEILALGFQLKREEDNQLVFEKKISAWSWGDVILVEKNDKGIFIQSKPKFIFNVFDYGLNKVRIEEIKKSLPKS